MNYYLRDDVKIEPLVARWHAHPFLVSPPAAAFMLRHHIEIMESFVRQPELHAMALGQSEMRSGPFLASQHSEDVNDVRSLLAHTRSSHAELLELASEIDAMVDLLRTATGASLDAFYRKLGPRLAGRVELAYEASGRAHFRLFEALFYAAYPPQAHQEFALSRLSSDARPFVMSTPRLAGRGDLILRMSFDSEPARALLDARECPVPRECLDAWFDMQGAGPKWTRAQVTDLFTSETARPAKPSSTEARIDYVGHACVLVHTGRETVLVDPLFGYRVPGGRARTTLSDLPTTIDCALITHAHHDHYVIETLLQIRDRTKTLVVPRSNPGNILDPSLELMSHHLGFGQVRAPATFETIELQTCRVHTIPFLGEHADLDISSKLGYRLEFDHHSMVFLADSNNLDPRLYEQIRDLYGPTDTAFIGLECVGAPASWSYGPLLLGSVSQAMDKSRRTGGSDAAKAMKVVQALGCRRVFVYAMAIEPWMVAFGGGRIKEGSMQDHEILTFLSECRSHGIAAELLDGSKSLAL